MAFSESNAIQNTYVAGHWSVDVKLYNNKQINSPNTRSPKRIHLTAEVSKEYALLLWIR
jgi:hypothetical protein